MPRPLRLAWTLALASCVGVSSLALAQMEQTMCLVPDSVTPGVVAEMPKAGSFLYSPGPGGNVSLFDAQAGGTPTLFRAVGFPAAEAISPDGRHALIVSQSGSTCSRISFSAEQGDLETGRFLPLLPAPAGLFAAATPLASLAMNQTWIVERAWGDTHVWRAWNLSAAIGNESVLGIAANPNREEVAIVLGEGSVFQGPPALVLVVNLTNGAIVDRIGADPVDRQALFEQIVISNKTVAIEDEGSGGALTEVFVAERPAMFARAALLPGRVEGLALGTAGLAAQTDHGVYIFSDPGSLAVASATVLPARWPSPCCLLAEPLEWVIPPETYEPSFSGAAQIAIDESGTLGVMDTALGKTEAVSVEPANNGYFCVAEACTLGPDGAGPNAADPKIGGRADGIPPVARPAATHASPPLRIVNIPGFQLGLCAAGAATAVILRAFGRRAR
ncbi:MAG: hypothetical protein ACYDDF_12245 [Thermoplasmatota archaeon]